MKGSFWWKSNLKLLDVFKGISLAEAGSGDTILFWKDLWNENITQNKYPHLFSFCINEDATLSMIMNQHDLHDCFQLPLSEQAFDQYCELELFLQALQPAYIWGSNQYSSSKAYKHLIGSQPVHPAYRWLWSLSCQQKHKVFYWLLLKNRLNTRV
jgi:hypothetical protein